MNKKGKLDDSLNKQIDEKNKIKMIEVGHCNDCYETETCPVYFCNLSATENRAS